jgi:hypothetical protein
MSQTLGTRHVLSNDEADTLIPRSAHGKRQWQGVSGGSGEARSSSGASSATSITGISPKRPRTARNTDSSNPESTRHSEEVGESLFVQTPDSLYDDSPSPDTIRQLGQLAGSRQRTGSASVNVEVSSSSDSDPAEVIFLDDDDEEDDEKTSGDILKEPPPTHVKERKGLRDVQCPVCLSEPEVVAITTCGHMYCSDCVFRALSSSNRATLSSGECSICRRKVQYRYVTFLEFKLGGKLDLKL